MRYPAIMVNGKDDFAKNTGFRVLPYLMQDNYESELKETELETIILENEFLMSSVNVF